MVIHQRLFEQVPYDPYITRGEDCDYLVNATHSGRNLLFDKRLVLAHLPPKRRLPYRLKFHQDIYRFAYLRRKLAALGMEAAGLDPYPGAFTLVKGERTKVLRVRPVVLKEPPSIPPGTVVAVDKKAIWVTCQDGVVGIEQLQPAGKEVMPTQDYINGHRIRLGEMFG